MDIFQQLSIEHSKKNTDLICNYIKSNPEKLHNLLEIFLDSEYRISQRAAMVIGEIGTKNPSILKPYELKLIHKIKESNIHDSVIRNITRIWQDFEFEEKYWGEYYGICYGFLEDNSIPIAIKVFSMTVCYKIVKEVPELKSELIFIIEENLKKFSSSSPGIINRGNKILFKLKNEI